VAYADFVTAMMSLFIVLWLMSSSEKVKVAVASYFNDPKGTANLVGTTMTGNGIAVGRGGSGDQGEEGTRETVEAD
jgi:chemotaxis protein MotB